MKFEIKHRWSNEVLFSIETESMKLAVEAAIKSGADLSRAYLSGAYLSGADLSGANLSGANLSGADLSGANLSRADLSGANLSRADLSGANLSGADLSRADLSEADLSRADLSRADLSGANLSRADLSGADLSRADLSGADLSGADLRYIKHDIWGVIIHAIPEIPFLRQALIDGKVDGSVYEGDCACLCGTIANARKCSYEKLDGITPNGNSMAEQFFKGIKKGDTPENNPLSKLVVEWIDEFVGLINKK